MAPLWSVAKSRARWTLPAAALLAVMIVGGTDSAGAPTAAVVLYPDHGPSGTQVLVWACGFDPKPWPNGATPDHFEITIDNTTVVATAPAGPCNNVSYGFGQKNTPPTVTIKGAPGKHHVFVSLVFSNTVATLAPAAEFTITGLSALVHPNAILNQPTASPSVIAISTVPPGAFVLSYNGTSNGMGGGPKVNQPLTISFSVSNQYKTFGPATTEVVAKLDGTLINDCFPISTFALNQTLSGALHAGPQSAGQHTLDLFYLAGPLAPPCPAPPSPGGGLRSLFGSVLAHTTATILVK
jgi:hypothetical protein